MAQVILSTANTTERFIEYAAPTRAELLAELNNNHEGMASAIAFGQAQDGTWYAIFDRALKVVLTMDDVLGMEEDRQNEDGIDVVLENTKVSMSA